MDTRQEPTNGFWARVPSPLEPEDVVVCGLASVSGRGLAQIGVSTGEFCVVVGQGVIGQCCAQIARIHGAHVLAADVIPKRLALAAEYSADTVWDSNTGDLNAEVFRRTGDRGADLVVEASGRKELIRQAIDIVRVYGKVLLQGWYPGDVSFDFHRTHMRQPTIAVACGIDKAGTERALRWISEGKLRIRPLVTSVFRPADAPSAYAMMRERPGEFLGVAFDWRA